MSTCYNIYSKRIKNVHESFLAKYQVNIQTGCWEWTGSLNQNGYGQLYLKKGKVALAHRYAYQTYIGEIKGLFVCHKCDNPKCCNPFHLFLGTPADNTQDAMSKNRLIKSIHPSYAHYKNHGCRCDECKKIGKEMGKKFREKHQEVLKKRKSDYHKKTYQASNRITTSKYRCVSFDKSKNKWVCLIRRESHTVFKKCFDTEYKAYKASLIYLNTVNVTQPDTTKPE